MGTRTRVVQRCYSAPPKGGQYAGGQFRKFLVKKFQQIISRSDNQYHNAYMEMYFSRFKAELLQDGIFESMEDGRTEIFEYIEMYYNLKPKHSGLNYESSAMKTNILIKQVNCP